jgi:hypothetical protein
MLISRIVTVAVLVQHGTANAVFRLKHDMIACRALLSDSGLLARLAITAPSLDFCEDPSDKEIIIFGLFH